jgi:hypothetical protein
MVRITNTPLGSRQAIWLCSKARGGKIVDYLTDEQRSYGDKEPVELGADLQCGPLATFASHSLNGSAFGEGIDCINLNSYSVSATSVTLILPLEASIFKP